MDLWGLRLFQIIHDQHFQKFGPKYEVQSVTYNLVDTSGTKVSVTMEPCLDWQDKLQAMMEEQKNEDGNLVGQVIKILEESDKPLKGLCLANRLDVSLSTMKRVLAEMKAAHLIDNNNDGNGYFLTTRAPVV